jgi:hypothetical protein
MTTQTLHLIDEYLMQGGYTPGIDAETLEREAALIAAAPDLLAALEHVDDYLAPQGDEEDVYNYIRAIIKGAISKAQGA